MPVAGSDLTPSHKLLNFTFLLISAGDFPLFNGTHHIVGRSEGYSGLSVHWSVWPALKITLREAVLILVRNVDLQTCTEHK